MKDSEMSTGIPKSVREAMSRQAVKGPHPAADDLTAYAERSLAEKEESAVVAHLATCAECREVVFLANSAYETPQKPVIIYERRSMWRWAMPATALLAFAIGFVVLLRNENPKVPQSAQVTKETQQVSAVNEQGAAKTEDKAADKAAPPRVTTAPPASAAKTTNGQPAPSLAKAKIVEKKSAADTKTQLAISRPADSPRQMTMTPTMTPIIAQPGVGGGVSGGIVSRSMPTAAYAPPPAPPVNVVDTQQNTNALSVQNLQLGGPSQRANQATMQKGVAASNTQGDIALKDSTAVAVPAAPTLHRRDETQLPEQRSTEGQFQAFATNSMELDAAPQKQQRNLISRMAITVWRISSDGHLERMMQDQWRRALGGVQKSFRAVAYLGNHVWAGGAGPELYHSADGGDSWSTLKVKTEDAELRGAMQSIKATDDKHVAIIADDGSVWVTNDGGTTWTKQ